MVMTLPWRLVVPVLVAGFVLLITLQTVPAVALPANGSFESTGSNWLSPWYFQVKTGGGGTVSQTSATRTHGTYSALINVTAGSASAPWLVQVSQSRLPIIAGQTYSVSFAAKAGAGRTLDIALQRTGSPYTVYAEVRFALTDAWQTFSFSHTAGVSDSDASLHFNLAGTTGSVWLDDVGVSTAPPSPSPTMGAATPTASPLASGSPTPRLPGPKGVALRPFVQYWGSNKAGVNSDFADMKSGGITWARLDLYKTTLPDPSFDHAVQAAKDHGINLLVTVRKPAPSNDLGTEADRAAYRLWLAQMVHRYKYHVKHWMIHNEPNLHYDWNIDDSPGSSQTQYKSSVLRYVSHLRDGFVTVRAIDPTAKVLFGGLSEWTVERYMDVLVTTDAHRYFDIMSFHPYGRDPDRVLSRFNSFKGKMNLNPNYAAKPIWVTEIGFNTSWSNKAGYVTSEQTKANYLAQTLPRLQAAGARLPVFWYTLHENDNVGGYALTRKNKTTLETQYLPAYYAYRDLVLPQ